VAQYPPGIAALDALPFAAGRALDHLLPAGMLQDGADLPPVGRVPRGVFFSAALIVLARNAAVLLGLLWTALALRRLGLPEKRTAAAVALTFFGGPLIFYSLVGMTHAPTFALAALLLFLLVRQPETGSLRLAFAAGAVVGAAVLVRYSAVALLPPALLGVALSATPGRQRRLAACLAGFALFLLPLPFWWHACFGSWLPPPYGGRWLITLASPWNVLFAPVHGLFLYHPALLCAAAGLLLRRRAAGPSPLGGGGLEQGGGQEGGAANGLTPLALLWLLSVAILHGWWSEWSNPGGYGQRFLIDALPAFALGFAGWLRPGSTRRLRVGLALAATFAGWLLFFAAVGALVPPPPPWPWPQRLSEYAALLRHPPGPGEILTAFERSSFLFRAMAP
jgi:4-amino-4-deoxy-L-arabinose transferase-like glycosyltransferase